MLIGFISIIKLWIGVKNMKAIFLSKGVKSFPDSQTGEAVNLTEVNFLNGVAPSSPDDDDKREIVTCFTRLEIADIQAGRLCEFFFMPSKSGKEKLMGIIPQ
jgi:hypothetical protein